MGVDCVPGRIDYPSTYLTLTSYLGVCVLKLRTFSSEVWRETLAHSATLRDGGDTPGGGDKKQRTRESSARSAKAPPLGGAGSIPPISREG